MTTLHILGSPVLPAHLDYRWDAFGVLIIKFIDNMIKRGWDCIHYGVEGCDVPCETVICIKPPCGALESVSMDSTLRNKCVIEYNKRAGAEIKARKNSGDLILCFYGWDNKPAAEENSDLKIIEPSIGYSSKAAFAPYKVFTSYAQMHLYYGQHDMLMNPSWFDAVIPNWFTPSEFEFKANKRDYFLYFGRIIETKGVHVAIQATERTGKKLIVAGTGKLSDLGYKATPSHVVEIGICDARRRKHLMRNAKAILGPTYYIEPFGNMVIEGYFSGTPAITTDWGGFVDTVVPGVTGYRCRDMHDFVEAIQTIQYIDPYDCYKYAMQNYAEDVVHDQFNDYFQKVIEGNFYRL